MRYYFEISFFTFGNSDSECKKTAYELKNYINSIYGANAEIMFQARSDFGKFETLKNECDGTDNS